MSSQNKTNNLQAPIDQSNVNIPHVDSDSILREHRLRLRLSGRLISLRHPCASNNNIKSDFHFLQQDHGVVDQGTRAENDSIKTWDDDWLEHLSNFKLLLIIPFVAIWFASCTKLVDAGAPVTSSNSDNVYTNDATAASVLTGIYINLSQSSIDGNGGLTSITSIAGLSSDELILARNEVALNDYYSNSLSSLTRTVWTSIYNTIFNANSAIEGLSSSNSLSLPVKHQLLGEAKFIRALCNFYLVNLYGDIPLVKTTDYKVNSLLPRMDKLNVYQQIVLDLKDAQSLLNSNYMDATGVINTSERVRPTRAAATALLARTYLFTKDYINAEMEATDVINNKELYDTVALNNVFLKNSKEAIWQLQPVGTGTNTNTKEGQFFIPLTATINSVPTYLTTNLINSFETGDKRFSNWINVSTVSGTNYYYPYKYKIGNVTESDQEYSMILRLAEQYLIRAEAKAQQNKITGTNSAAEDLNVIRTRAGLNNTTASSKEAMLLAIEHERKVELFTEWGHRWLDLKRANRADEVLAPLKGSNWQTTDQLYPIPQIDIDRNPSLQGHQNPGYN
jgi:hypothetical protein